MLSVEGPAVLPVSMTLDHFRVPPLLHSELEAGFQPSLGCIRRWCFPDLRQSLSFLVTSHHNESV